ncbi:MAG TPA: serine/threonine-protein kinase [Euzebyales bacterium]
MSAVPQQPLPEPTSLGTYTLQSVVGSDLTTTTYRAIDDVGTPVALRVVDDAVAGHARAVKGFLHVNRRVSAVAHPHLLTVVDQGTVGGTPYAATTWRDGVSLGDLLLEAAPLDIDDALRLGGQLAEALDAIHHHGIVHGTVGLPSVWIRRRPGSRVPPSAAVTGFGTSHLLGPVLQGVEDDPAAPDLLFVAPEQLQGQPAGPASDQYALACILYTALTATTPYQGETNNDLFGAHLFGQARPITELRQDLDDRWDALFARALSKDPEERYDNCRTLLLEAGRCGRRRPAREVSSARPVAVSAADDVAEFEPAPRRTLRIVLIVLLLVVLGLLAALELDVIGSPDAAASSSPVLMAVIAPGGG